MVSNIYTCKSEWTAGYGGEQFSLGEVFSHYSETGQQHLYWLKAAEGRNKIKKYIPILYPKILSFLQLLVNDKVGLREYWSGPSVVIFPAYERCATIGGEAHYDWDGLTAEPLSDYYIQAYSE